MDQQVIAFVCFAIVVASLFASYLKYRKSGTGSNDEKPQTVSGVMDEACEYFGVRPTGKDGMTRALDLAPLQMLSGMTTPQGKGTRARKKR